MIYVDVSAAVHSRAGLGRYSLSLAEALIREQPSRFALFYNRGGDGRLPDSLQGVPSRHVELGYKPWRLAVLLAHLVRISFRRLVPDVSLFHSTEHLLMPLGSTPTALTVHDLIYRRFPAYHKRLNYWYLNLAMPLYCRRASAIIAVSESSKRDIVSHYGIDPDKIHVVHEAAAGHFAPPREQEVARARRQYELPERYLIHLGTVEPRKNLDRLVEALLALRGDRPDLHLVLAGGKGWLYEDFFARLQDQGLEGIVRHLGWVPDADLPAVIAAAELAVQPSLYEGFGLPLLEHMACGQLVAASNTSSHPEIGGQAVAYFDPLDVGDMVAVVRRLLLDPEERRRRQLAGLEQAGKFSWRQAALGTISVYDQHSQRTPGEG
jgi:glycosyltransferase involved in cell wall biosynthesis